MPYGNEHNFEGIYVATICPMHTDGSIDEEGLTDHFSNLINFQGIVGFLINGHASENHLLNRNEKRRIVEIAKNTICEYFMKLSFIKININTNIVMK